MSNLNDFKGGGVQIGGLVSFPDTLANIITLNGATYLKTGVIALASAYPQVPAALLVNVPQLQAPVVTPASFRVVAGSTSLGLFVASDSVNIYSSPDGITWTLRQAFACTFLYWTGSRFLALSAGTNYYWSTNGTTWTSGTLPVTAGNIVNNKILQVGNILHVVNAATTYSYSTDGGANWLTGTYPGALNGSPTTVVATTSAILIFDSTTYIYYSTNGSTWTAGVAHGGSTNLVGHDGTYAYFSMMNINTNSAAIIASGNSMTGVYRTSDGVNITYVGPAYAADKVMNYCNFIGGMSFGYSGTGTPPMFTYDFVSVRALPGLFSAGLNYAGLTNFSAYAAITGTIIGVNPKQIGNMQRWTTPLPMVDNFTSSSNATGSRNYMRVG